MWNHALAVVNKPLPAASLLAGGLGRRMGGLPKPALRIGGISLLERLVGALRCAGIADVSVVLGPYRSVLEPLAQRCRARILTLEHEGAALEASQNLALCEHLRHHPHQDLLIVLADMPLLAATDIAHCLQSWQQRAPLTVAQFPVVQGVRGHPVLLSWLAAKEIVHSVPPVSIRDWLAKNNRHVQALSVHQEAYIRDLDTPADLATLREQLNPLTVEFPAGVLDKCYSNRAHQA